MIGLLHGYLLEGSGSNLWTKAVVRSLCARGSTVHLFCQEPRPEEYDFVAEAWRHPPNAPPQRVLERAVPYRGRCVLHQPLLGDTLPVYVRDDYDEFANVVPMVELPDEALEDYVERNRAVVARVVERAGIDALHANHAVLMSVVAQRVREASGLPYAVMPHGSALEYAVKPDERLRKLAAEALDGAARILVIGDEMRRRVRAYFPDLPGLDAKMRELPLGVDTALFRPATDAVERARRLSHLRAGLAGAPRGKRRVQIRLLRDALDRNGADPAALADAVRAAADYPGKRPDEALEERLPDPQDRPGPLVLFVGRLIPEKGPQAVLAAFPLILERHPDARLVVVGHGPLREPLEAMAWALEHGRADVLRTLAREARALAGQRPEPLEDVAAFLDDREGAGALDAYFAGARERLGEDRVVFAGYLRHDRLRHLFACADVAVFPSLVREAGPLVFLEALASGCYPLGTDFGGTAATIDALGAALSEELADGMRLRPEPRYLVRDIARRTRAALDARPDPAVLREYVVGRHDWRSVAERLEAVLESMPRGRG